ncbi:MAG: NAD+ synthase [Candidatus Aminicenantaceae bacterium]
MKINCRFVEKILTSFIKEELTKFNFKKGLLGLSGGLDSTLCAYFSVKAMGKQNIIGLILPYKETFKKDTEDAKEIAKKLGIEYKIIDISPMIDLYYQNHPNPDKNARGNKMARERMSILYEFSSQYKAMVLGTSNKTELLIGYGTIHGDMACGINPLGDLYKTQIRQLAQYMGIPDKIVNKKPTAGLWSGQSDEQEIGLEYEELDSILYQLADKRRSKDEIISLGYKKESVEKIIHLVKTSEFKRKLPPIPKVSSRTVGHDFLYPYDWDK